MKHKTSIIVLVAIISVLGVVTAYKYYRFMEEDPAFCSLCHMTEEGYRSWEQSKHYTLICQECHRMSMIEGNKLLVAYYVAGKKDIDQKHGRKAPWEVCQNCHSRAATQGSITFRESYGHARHVFMQGISCRQCHVGEMHRFNVDSSRCQKCHVDKLVHGMGTAGLHCLNCHSFTEAAEHMTSSKRCYGCHDDIPTRGVMSQLECYDCHHPHRILTVESKDCLGECHGPEVRAGVHGKHLAVTSLTCLDCHKPHTWVVRKEGAKGLCDRCHEYRDPATFIY